tara:strand:+ start:1292 stop:1513 length:222 start_codon:yes stop_codon:yes gene_type:complete
MRKLIELFTKHPMENAGKTYLEHAMFIWEAGVRLAMCSAAYMIHGLLPFIQVPARLNFDQTIIFLSRKNNEVS